MRAAYSSYVELEAAQLPIQSHMRTICPACDGGSKHERSLLISREFWGIHAHCFRATCNFTQSITANEVRNIGCEAPMTATNQYLGTFDQLQSSDLDYFRQRFDLNLKEWNPIVAGYNEKNQYVMPILDRFELRQGYVVRQTPWKGDPLSPRMPVNPYHAMGTKVRSWPDNSKTVMISVYKPRPRHVAIAPPPGIVVLTEDQISAMKAAQSGTTGVALLGVGLNLDKVREIHKLQPTRVIVALDPDAGHLAFDMVNKWSAAFPDMRVALLDQDLKDIDSVDVLGALGLLT